MQKVQELLQNTQHSDALQVNFNKLNKAHGKLAAWDTLPEGAEFNSKHFVKLAVLYKDTLEHLNGHLNNLEEAISLLKQLPKWEKGLRVAVKPENSDWILAHILKQVSPNVWEVEDAEDDEDNPGRKKRYRFHTRAILPIGHVKELPIGSKCLALYPGSSCFYHATIVLNPTIISQQDLTEYKGCYVVKFEDDNDVERAVLAELVLESPETRVNK